MRSRSLAALGTLALLAAANAFGQQRTTVDIPFEFTFANKVMPAGHYDVTSTSTLVLVRSYTSWASAFSLANRVSGGNDGNTGSRLVFNKYGNRYFLAEVWALPETGSGAAPLESKTERGVAHGSRDAARVTIPVRTGAVTLASLK